MVTLGEMLISVGFQVRLRINGSQFSRVVRGVLVTEIVDPRHLLDGGEVVLTTGLRQGDPVEQASFVRWITAAGAVALGFAAGRAHETVPATTLAAAAHHDLPVLELPSSVSIDWFRGQISELMEPRQESWSKRIDTARSAMLDMILSGQGVEGVIDCLGRVTGAPVAMVNVAGEVLVTAPRDYEWPPNRLSGGAVRITPIDAQPDQFLLSTSQDDTELSRHAARLIGRELSQQQAVRAGRRELTGQVLADLVRATISSAEGERRLTEAGLDLTGKHTVLAILPGPGTPAPPLHALPPVEAVTAFVPPYEVVILSEDQPIAEVIRRLLPEGEDHPALGVGGPYRGVHGLRWALLEAQSAVALGPGVHPAGVINIPRLLMSNPDLPLREVAQKVLEPLVEFDTRHNGELIRTLDTFLASDGSAQATGRRLFVHRNTVRYRLEQIEHLTGLSLSSIESTVHLWLAMRAVSEPAGGPVRPEG